MVLNLLHGKSMGNYKYVQIKVKYCPNVPYFIQFDGEPFELHHDFQINIVPKVNTSKLIGLKKKKKKKINNKNKFLFIFIFYFSLDLVDFVDDFCLYILT